MMKRLKKHFDFYPPVFYPAVGIIILFLIVALLFGEPFEENVSQLQEQLFNNFGWLIIGSVNFFLVLLLIFAFGKFGKIRIGGKDAKPEFSFFAWFSMLFTAGMGSGALFFSVAEPVIHFNNPPLPVENNAEAAVNAMKFAYLHHGFHGWSFYLIIGLAVAFFHFNRQGPLTISAAFTPVLRGRSALFWGALIDITAVIATLFGVALSLGIAAQLIANGLNKLFGLADTLALQLTIIITITLRATISVVLGLKRGIRVLSKLNIRLALILMFMMLVLGPTAFIFDSFVQNTGAYLQDLITLGTRTEAGLTGNWQNKWTLFYWVWWIAWAPFVGIFLARISKGRTVRSFIISGLVAPVALLFFWYAVFGGSALHLEMEGIGDLANSVKENPAAGFFTMISQYPLSWINSLAFLILGAIFFTTSSDSASLVNDYLTSGGNTNPPKGQRIFWAVTEGIVAIILLSFGGFGAINGVVTLSGFPFLIVLLIMCYSLYKGLKQEYLNLKG